MNYARTIFNILLTACGCICLSCAAVQATTPARDEPAPSWRDILAKKPVYVQGWRYIVIHNSGANSGNAGIFDAYHKKMGYGGLCYHYIIDNGNGGTDGNVETGWRWTKGMAGTHVNVYAWPHNIFGIGICLVGDFNSGRPSEKQLQSLRTLVAGLAVSNRIDVSNIIGHYEVPNSTISWTADDFTFMPSTSSFQATSCPGKNFNMTNFRAEMQTIIRTRKKQAN